jgi:hypothetical protein
MPLLITLRRDTRSSPFRRQLQRLCAIPGGHDLLLCSGYIYEPDSGYSVLADELGKAISGGIGKNVVTTIAGKLAKGGYIDWLANYRNFVNRLRGLGVSVTAYVAPERNWHAKIAIRLDGRGAPLAAIVGSSNLTAPAYRERQHNWNYECDVTIWKRSPQLDQHFRAQTGDVGDPFEEISTILDAEVRQPDEQARMTALLQDIRRDEQDFVLLEEYER